MCQSRTMQQCKWRRSDAKIIVTLKNTLMGNKVTGDYFPSKLPETSSLTAIGYWDCADYQQGFLLSCSLLFLVHAPDRSRWEIQAYCLLCSQLTAAKPRPHSQYIPDSSKAFIPHHQSAAAHPYVYVLLNRNIKAWKLTFQSVITSLKLNEMSSNLKAICSYKLFTLIHLCHKNYVNLKKSWDYVG